MAQRFAAFIFALSAITITAFAQKQGDSAYFQGTLVYTTSAFAADLTQDTSMVEMFRGLAPSSYTLTYGSEKQIRLKEEGGLTGADMIVDLAGDRYYQLDREAQVAHTLQRASYDEYFAPTVLLPLDESEIIEGYTCHKYKVESSPFVRPGAEAYVWVSDSIRLLPERGEYTYGESFRAFFPLPTILGISQGTVLKMVVTETNTVVTFIASIQPGSVDEALFTLPEGYKAE